MRCQVYIPKELEEVLLNDAKKAGVNVSEIIIRILKKNYISRKRSNTFLHKSGKRKYNYRDKRNKKPKVGTEGGSTHDRQDY